MGGKVHTATRTDQSWIIFAGSVRNVLSIKQNGKLEERMFFLFCRSGQRAEVKCWLRHHTILTLWPADVAPFPPVSTYVQLQNRHFTFILPYVKNRISKTPSAENSIVHFIPQPQKPGAPCVLTFCTGSTLVEV